MAPFSRFTSGMGALIAAVAASFHGSKSAPVAGPSVAPTPSAPRARKSRHPRSKLVVMGRLIRPAKGQVCVYSQKRQMRKRISLIRGITTGRQWVKHRKAMQRGRVALGYAPA